MIKDIVLQAALKHEFTLFNTGDYSKADDVTIEYSAGETLAGLEGVDYKSLTYFSQDSGDRKRFLAVVECGNIPSPQVLNKLVLLYAPEAFKSDPAFDKNTDLIILHKLRHRADFNGIESKVFGIEENPYYFKKYFLYYSEEELRLLEGHNFESVSAMVVDDRMFAEYRDQPLSRFAEDLMEQLKSDPELIDILVEYHWLIAARANIFSPAERFCAATGASRDPQRATPDCGSAH